MAACFSAIKRYVTLCGFQTFLFIAVQSAGLYVNNSQQSVRTSHTEDHGSKLFFWRREKAVFFLGSFCPKCQEYRLAFLWLGMTYYNVPLCRRHLSTGGSTL